MKVKMTPVAQFCYNSCRFEIEKRHKLQETERLRKRLSNLKTQQKFFQSEIKRLEECLIKNIAEIDKIETKFNKKE